MKISFV